MFVHSSGITQFYNVFNHKLKFFRLSFVWLRDIFYGRMVYFFLKFKINNALFLGVLRVEFVKDG